MSATAIKNVFTLKALKPRNTIQTSETPKIKDGLRVPFLPPL
jgi:hypothetical protein